MYKLLQLSKSSFIFEFSFVSTHSPIRTPTCIHARQFIEPAAADAVAVNDDIFPKTLPAVSQSDKCALTHALRLYSVANPGGKRLRQRRRWAQRTRDLRTRFLPSSHSQRPPQTHHPQHTRTRTPEERTQMTPLRPASQPQPPLSLAIKRLRRSRRRRRRRHRRCCFAWRPKLSPCFLRPGERRNTCVGVAWPREKRQRCAGACEPKAGALLRPESFSASAPIKASWVLKTFARVNFKIRSHRTYQPRAFRACSPADLRQVMVVLGARAGCTQYR